MLLLIFYGRSRPVVMPASYYIMVTRYINVKTSSHRITGWALDILYREEQACMNEVMFYRAIYIISTTSELLSGFQPRCAALLFHCWHKRHFSANSIYRPMHNRYVARCSDWFDIKHYLVDKKYYCKLRQYNNLFSIVVPQSSHPKSI